MLASGLRVRFLLIVLLSLLPVMVLSVMQGVERLRLDQENVRDKLRQSAYVAASDELNVFSTAEQLLRTLSSEDTVRQGGMGCRTRLLQALEGADYIANFGRISATGELLCVAHPPTRPAVITEQPWWKEILADR